MFGTETIFHPDFAAAKKEMLFANTSMYMFSVYTVRTSGPDRLSLLIYLERISDRVESNR